MDLWSKFFWFSVFLFLLLPISFSRVNAVDKDVVALQLADTEEALDSAYDAVFEAEEAGANVTGLLVRLNVGGEYLSKAFVWFRLGVFENASRFAGFCREIVGSIGGEAVGLRDEAERLAREDVLVRVFGSAVSVMVVLVLGFFVWGIFKRRYRKRLLGFKPEVVSGES
jgi:hypothetical protein